MNSLRIATQGNRTAFRPGETISGAAGWSLGAKPRSAEVRLFWFTEGKGTRDLEIVDTIAFAGPGESEERAFSFTLPQAPYSFSGRLISLIWAVELVIEPGEQAERIQIKVSPTGEEVLLANMGKTGLVAGR
jgi:hypothetical protein